MCRFFQTEMMLTILWPLHETFMKQVLLVDTGMSFGEKKQCLCYNIGQETGGNMHASLFVYLCLPLSESIVLIARITNEISFFLMFSIRFPYLAI